jgi:hypothetical protein
VAVNFFELIKRERERYIYIYRGGAKVNVMMKSYHNYSIPQNNLPNIYLYYGEAFLI